MSLVNDMLRDLDARQRGALSGVSAAGTSGYRDAQRKSRKRLVGLVLVGTVLCLLAAYLVVRSVAPWVLNDTLNVLSPDQAQPHAEQAQVSSEPSNIMMAAAYDATEARFTTTEQVVVDQLLAAPSLPATPAIASTASVAGLNTVNKVSWTGLADEQGYLSLWLSETGPYTVYEKSPQVFEWGMANTGLAAELPTELSSKAMTLTQVPSESDLRFRVETREPMRFKPSLRRNPSRMVIDISKPAAPVPPASERVTAAVTTDTEITSTENVAAPQAPTRVDSTGSWRKAMNTQPTDSSTVRDARRLLTKNDVNAAIQRLEGFVAQHARSDQSRYLLAQLYLSTENYSSARRIIDGAPANVSWALLNARALLQQGDGSGALTLLRQYPEAENREDYLDLLASAYQQRGEHSQAVQAYLTVLALNPQQARAWINMGVSFEHLGQRSKAVDAYQNALRIPQLPANVRQFAAQQLQRLQ